MVKCRICESSNRMIKANHLRIKKLESELSFLVSILYTDQVREFSEYLENEGLEDYEIYHKLEGD
tara:strand:- start:542 stop:736 length:195 start_codon:yes stop_codon:yes gene_type:complete